MGEWSFIVGHLFPVQKHHRLLLSLSLSLSLSSLSLSLSFSLSVIVFWIPSFLSFIFYTLWFHFSLFFLQFFSLENKGKGNVLLLLKECHLHEIAIYRLKILI